ncbi:SDR family NAD(P)-dependent oxidoreductase, partial [bacterium]|nr:SDR family NAD(P)-dependent oxidoreductase [bacterium]
MTKSTNKTILITGGIGFIGSHLCESLAAQGNQVIAFDNFDPFYERSLKDSNAASLREHQIEIIEGDIRDAAALTSAITAHKPDTIVHLAARAGVRPSLEDPLTYVDVNLGGTIRLLEAAREAGIRNFVFASSSSVYGMS